MKKIIFYVILLSLLGCTKSSDNLLRLPAGTKCTIVPGVFGNEAFQPSPPLTIEGIYQDDGGLIMYNATDSKGIVWQIPSNDLVVVK